MIIFLYGPDSFQAQKKLTELKNKFLKEVDSNSTSLSVIDGSDINLGRLNDLLASNSLFVSKRLIIIKNIFKNNKDFLIELLDYLKKIKETDNIIIFYDDSLIIKKQKNKTEVHVDDKKLAKNQQDLFNYLQKQKYTQYFGLLDNNEINVWIKQKLVQENVKINYQASQLLVGLLGNDLWMINSELDKLVHYKRALMPDQKDVEISLNDVEEMVKGQIDQGIFALTDAIGNKNKALAVKLFSDQIKIGAADYYLITMLIRQFRILLQIRQGLDSGWTSRKIGSYLKVHPYVLQKGINQAGNFNLISLKNIFHALVRLDFNYKTGRLNAETMVDLLIAKI
ncbi:MAG: DNA polymerase III subunit delta [bacterium]